MESDNPVEPEEPIKPVKQVNFVTSEVTDDSMAQIVDQTNLKKSKDGTTDQDQYFLVQNIPRRMKKSFWKWIVMLIIIYLSIAQIFCQVIPQGIQSYLQKDLKISPPQYGYISIASYIPNMILPAFAGLIIDRLGNRNSLIAMCVGWVMAQGLLQYGAFINNYPLVFVGTVLVGVTTGSMSVNFSIFISKWFMGDLLATAMGLMMAAQCLSSLMSQLLLPPLYEWANALWAPYLSGLILSGLAIFFAIGLAIIDYKMDKSFGELKEVECPDKFVISDLGKMNTLFWFWSINLAYTNLTQTAFTNYAQGIIMDYGFISSATKASLLTDKIGMKGELMNISIVIELCGFIIMYFFFGDTWAIFTFICIWGLVQSLQNSLQYSTIPLIIEEKFLGTGFGLTVCFNYIGNTVGPLITGTTCTNCVEFTFCQQYKNTIAVLLFMTIGSLVYALFIWIYDLKNQKKLRIIQVNKVNKSTFVSGRGGAVY